MNIKILLATSLSLITSYIAYTFITGNNQVISPSLAAQLNAPKINGAQLQNILSAAVTNQKVPGAVMYVSTPNGKWIGASGVSNLETKTAMKTNDGFSIASTSKTFVSVAVLKLVEAGKIDLDGAIAEYLPADISPNITNSDLITVRQQLNNTSGVAEYLSTDGFKNATKKRSRSQPWTARSAIKYISLMHKRRLGVRNVGLISSAEDMAKFTQALFAKKLCFLQKCLKKCW
ncbi:MAG: beta-lactamase family protein [Calothrix sp. FI2-JRJ7]|jgi:D-alanyl-D-alanine carboxypeptidase|nr:beta-lactamase family protein [Calothrix sp. FI2-JRJ7]